MTLHHGIFIMFNLPSLFHFSLHRVIFLRGYNTIRLLDGNVPDNMERMERRQ
jgi:hypothetical protein